MQELNYIGSKEWIFFQRFYALIPELKIVRSPIEKVHTGMKIQKQVKLASLSQYKTFVFQKHSVIE